ncbi:MAG: urea carboxylase-associated family protein [Actinoplanes sp.]
MITLRLNHQQRDFLQGVVDRDPHLDDIGALVRTALTDAPAHSRSPATPPVGPAPPSRTPVAEHILGPGTGKAFEVSAGRVIRIEQIEGHQCVDLNVFVLADPRERLHVGRTRGMQGRHPAPGDVLWSNAPWERPIMAIVGGAATTDTQFPFCSRLIYSAFFGRHDRTNCQEIQNEAQREYGLAPWDIHESLNLFMHTGAAPDGEPVIHRNRSRPGDHLEFVALLDLLVVPNVCGDDLSNCSNFGLRPVRVTIEHGRPADAEHARSARERAVSLGLPEPREVPGARPLRRDPGYVAAFPYLPLRPADVRVEAGEALTRRFGQARNTELYADDDAAALRDIVLSWAIERLGAFTGNA